MSDFTEADRQMIAASGRTLLSEQRGSISAIMLRPEDKPNPGDILPCPHSMHDDALVLNSGTMGPFKDGDGMGMQPGLHYWFDYAMVRRPVVADRFTLEQADRVVADSQASRCAHHKEYDRAERGLLDKRRSIPGDA